MLYYRYNTAHEHGHLLAGVLYIANTEGCEADPDGGWLEFFDPRVQISAEENQWWGHYGGFRIKPRDGMIMLFPGYVRVCVRACVRACVCVRIYDVCVRACVREDVWRCRP